MSTGIVHTDAIYPDWSFGDRLRKARTIARMNQEDFADAIGVKDGSLAAWETDRARPRDIVAIAKSVEAATRIPASWILGIEGSPPDPSSGPFRPNRTRRGTRLTGTGLPPDDSSIQPVGWNAAA